MAMKLWLDLMWVLQEACFEYYPSITKVCPNNAPYDSVNNSCTCNNLGWNGSGC